MRFIPTWLHGILDYLTVGTLLALPRRLGWGRPATNALTGAAAGMLGYSLATRYELGLLKRLPMPAHLMLDAMGGAALCAAPFLLPLKKRQRGAITRGFLAFGLCEIAAALTARTRPAWTARDVGEAVGEMGESLAATVS